MEWQPIETAPKDGMYILLTGGTVNYGWDYDALVPPIVVGQWSVSAWQFAWFESGYYGEYEDPTHWLSLDALPTPPPIQS